MRGGGEGTEKGSLVALPSFLFPLSSSLLPYFPSPYSLIFLMSVAREMPSSRAARVRFES